MKNLILIFSILASTSTFVQINEDAKKIARKGIKEITLDKGQCVLKFDTLGRLWEMRIDPFHTEEEVYKFDEKGNWISYEELRRREPGKVGDDVKYLKQSVTNSYDSTHELIYQVAVYFDKMILRGSADADGEADTTIYQKIKSTDTTKLSVIEYSSSAMTIENVRYWERDKYSYLEETELICNLNDTAYQVDYYNIRYTDTITHSRLFYFVAENGLVDRINKYDLDSNRIDREYYNCELIENYKYRCTYRYETGEIEPKIIQLRKIPYSRAYVKEHMDNELPKSRWAGYKYTFFESPYKALKAILKAGGENSVEISYY
jgi:hypothetical protein